ncbi:hypothetical protein GH714_016133 [Hevea brasiliensis]|uniref:NAD-dependent epimerase/dehydratase domain-containing protein n=1 Tax=Hevea brasiliensis TaxID=3981 RepID=A0A6A6MEK6_HEVBR|nr:hypothetical protein GH714_016133 [Hevea brasiliensis]
MGSPNHDSPSFLSNKSSKIFVAGHRGLVGSAIVRKFQVLGFTNLILRTHAEFDLTRQSDVESFFSTEKPEFVILAAAKVGGIHANNTYPADFIAINLQIQTNVIDSSYRHGVKKLLFLGSSCIYPKLAPQPIPENALLTGPLEPTNECGLEHVNVGSGKEVTIKELAESMKEVVGFEGELVWDTSKPDGTPRKLMDSSKLLGLGWMPKISLKDGLIDTYKWYVENVIKQ